jgi:hypothetical protein
MRKADQLYFGANETGGARTMTTRSQLLNNVLRTWDESIEGYLYLRWLIDPGLSIAFEGKGHPQLEAGISCVKQSWKSPQVKDYDASH